jgi:hypothetical protein
MDEQDVFLTPPPISDKMRKKESKQMKNKSDLTFELVIGSVFTTIILIGILYLI